MLARVILLAWLSGAAAVYAEEHTNEDTAERAPASARPEEADSAESLALIRELKTNLDELKGVVTGYRPADDSMSTGEGRQPSTFWSIPQ